MAPELFPDFDILIDEDAVDDDNSPLFSPELTKETDVYAYGLVLLQVPPKKIIYPGSPDLGDLPCDFLYQIHTGKDPKPYHAGAPKPQLLPKRRHYDSVNDQLWRLVQECCHLDARKRPTMQDVTRQLSQSRMSNPRAVL